MEYHDINIPNDIDLLDFSIDECMKQRLYEIGFNSK